jgi:cytochrome c biogenesis protein
MATTETEVASKPDASPAVNAPAEAKPKQKDLLDKFLDLLSSVRFGLVMLGILLSCCMIGMLIMQVNIEGFDKYYAQLRPAQQKVYGWLGFFDIYRSRYFTLLLAITGLNIILASIQRFPTAWSYIIKPKLSATPKYISSQMFTAQANDRHAPEQAAEQIKAAWRKMGFRGKVTDDKGRLTVFAQRNTWNRLGAYAVHVGLLTIFTGGFMTSRMSIGGQMEITPGKTSETFVTQDITTDGTHQERQKLPFKIECTEIEQKLIREEGSLEQQNTIDWLSWITIKDGEISKDMLVHLNNVGDYRGYRFFQSQFVPVGHASEITVTFEADDGSPAIGPVKIKRNGSAEVPGVGTVKYVDFQSEFERTEQGGGMSSAEYTNPVAVLDIKGPDGNSSPTLAMNPQFADRTLKNASPELANQLKVGGRKAILREYKKASLSHILTVQYDPGRTPVYAGFTILMLALSGVFLFAHQRVWAVIEPQERGSKIHFGGHTNRNRPAFEARFNSLVQSATGGPKNE